MTVESWDAFWFEGNKCVVLKYEKKEMTVEELIEILKKFPPDSLIYHDGIDVQLPNGNVEHIE